jgi:hypothetical protein
MIIIEMWKLIIIKHSQSLQYYMNGEVTDFLKYNLLYSQPIAIRVVFYKWIFQPLFAVHP